MRSEAPSLALISGWGATGALWGPLLELLDSRWAARAEVWPWWELLEEPTARLARAGDGTPPVLVGWSLGGMLALEAALAAPGRIRGLFLLGATARLTEAPDHPGVPESRLRSMALRLTRDRPALGRDFASACLGQDAEPGRHESFLASFRAQWSSCPAGALSRGLERLTFFDLRERLALLAVPTCLVYGSGDRIVPPSQGVLLADRLPGLVRSEGFQGAGHALPYTHPDRVVPVLSEFLDGLAAREGRDRRGVLRRGADL